MAHVLVEHSRKRTLVFIGIVAAIAVAIIALA